MSYKLNFAFLCLLIIALGAGCNVSNYFETKPATNSNQAVLANKTLVDQAAEKIFGAEKTGIPQCDEVLAELEKPTANSNESLVDRGKRELIKQTIYSQIRSASANSTTKEKAEIGKYCEQAAAQLKNVAAPQSSPVKK